jgi:adenylate cyclase
MAEVRKLAAILAADVVGFSRLTGADEDRTLARLRALRSDLIDPTIAVHNGRVFKRTGDGALVEFRSVVDAVRCAIEVQNAMVERNAGVAHDRRIEFRIGIHVGDVVEESDGDMMGDSVNIAARLEGIAKPGAICLSEQAYWPVKTRLDIAVSDLGATQLKNIAEPVRAFSLQVGLAAEARPAAPVEPSAAERPAERPSVSDKPSIAVLPFQNMSGDAEQEYFCDGLVEDIITTLSKLDGLRIIARNSSFVYKGRSVDVREAAQQLGVRYVLEGSVRRSGARIRVTAQLIDAADGSHLWAERYDRAVDDIFAIQDEITLVLATEMQDRRRTGANAVHDDQQCRSLDPLGPGHVLFPSASDPGQSRGRAGVVGESARARPELGAAQRHARLHALSRRQIRLERSVRNRDGEGAPLCRKGAGARSGQCRRSYHVRPGFVDGRAA